VSLLDDAEAAERACLRAHHHDGEHLAEVCMALNLVLQAMREAPWFDDRWDPLYAHLMADNWRWAALARQPSVRSVHVSGVRTATLNRLALWRRLLLDRDDLARRQVEAPQPSRADSLLVQRAEQMARLALRDSAREAMERKALLLGCPHCRVQPGDPCLRRPSGQPAPEPHTARTAPLVVEAAPCPVCKADAGQPCVLFAEGMVHRDRRAPAALALLRESDSS